MRAHKLEIKCPDTTTVFENYNAPNWLNTNNSFWKSMSSEVLLDLTSLVIEPSLGSFFVEIPIVFPSNASHGGSRLAQKPADHDLRVKTIPIYFNNLV